MNRIIHSIFTPASGRRKLKTFFTRQRSIQFYSFTLSIALGTALVLTTMITPVRAAVLNVDTTTDDAALTACDDATPNDCSLRGAIIKANGLAEASTINVPAGTYVLTQPSNCFLRTSQFGNFSLGNITSLCFAGNITLIGAGADSTIIDGNQAVGNNGVIAPVMFVGNNAPVEIQKITMKKGNFSVGSGFGHGGGIHNAGTLTLDDCVLTENFTPGPGGGIYNGGTLTVLRSKITQNVTNQDGGGIFNASFNLVTPVTVSGSAISNNVADGSGGGISNFGGIVTMTGSTVSGNRAGGLGGGIANFNNTGVLILTNSTITGNRSGSVGGGIVNWVGLTTVHLNNVTFTDNFSSNDGGGVYNNGGSFTIANTLIAGNQDLFNISHDCRGQMISEGYNLIQDTRNCQLAGDTTGNVTGQDAKLGALADNGGLTPTHALGDGSPAIDAGNPAVPGGGGTACAVTDQRGFLRPLGAACDIGAFERVGAFSVTRILPSSGGNAGTVSTLVSGNGFVKGVVVKLTRAGEPDIVANPLQADVGGSAIAATFDLTGRPSGLWDVVVVNPDSTSQTLPAGFTIEAGGAPDLWVDVIGLLRRHEPSTFTIFYGNRGNVDALGVPLSLSLPNGYQWARFFDVTPPPASGELRPDWSLVSEGVGLPGQLDFLQIPLFLPLVPSGFSGVLRLSLVLPLNATDTFMFAAAGDPVVTPQAESAFIDQAVAGAKSYVEQGFAVTVPDSVVAQLQQYATTQLHAMIANGQAAFAASLGTAPQVYSLGQWQIDLVLFVASRTPPPGS